MSRPQRGCRQPHGTNARYTAGCSCLDCCEAHAEYQRQRGPKTTVTNVPVEVLQRHVRVLKQRGMSRRAISDMSGVSYKTLRNIDDAVYDHVTADTAAALLELRGPIPSETTALISARGTHQVIEGLQRLGFSLDRIAAECGWRRKSLPPKSQHRVQARTALRIRQAADRLRAERKGAAA